MNNANASLRAVTSDSAATIRVAAGVAMSTAQTTVLEAALAQAETLLQQFALSGAFDAGIAQAFGAPLQAQRVVQVQQVLASGQYEWPSLEVRGAAELQGALGAYAAKTRTIYVSDVLVGAGLSGGLVAVLIEEIGHDLDAMLTPTGDAAGDEGAIFSAVVRGVGLSEEALAAMRQEDDSAVLRLDGELVAVERASFTVTNTNDSGAGSLRQAILDANAAAGADTIMFDSSAGSVFADAVADTIALAGSELLITDDLTISGPGADQLTIDAGGQSRVFRVDDGDFNNVIDVTLDGLTVNGGSASDGGGGILSRESLTVINSTVSGNAINGYISAGGGGISSVGRGGDLSVINSTVSDNTTNAIRSYGGTGGGGIFSRYGDVSVINSTVSGNATNGDFSAGGGIYSNFGDVSVINSTVSGNATNGDFSAGGGIASPSSNLSVINSTVSGNATNGGSRSRGGGIYSNFGTLSLSNSIVSGNDATNEDGDEIYSGTFNTSVTSNGNILGDSNKTSGDAFGNFTSSTIDIVATSDGNTPTALSAIIAPLADNGGTTQTHALQPGSPALNAGNNANIAPDTTDQDGDGTTTEPSPFDQRGTGFARAVGTVDIGAFELQNASPVITTPGSASVNENQTTAIDVNATDDSSSEGNGLTYRITGGADQSKFSIDGATGIVSFAAAPDFEAPSDDNSDNIYQLQVTVTDAGGSTDVQDIAITVADVFENTAPTITSSNAVSVNENQKTALTVTATDNAPAGVRYSITGGADRTLFAIDDESGELSFVDAPNFESPDDVGTDNTYRVEVTATDGEGLSDVETVVVSVSDVNDAPVAIADNLTIKEDTLLTGNVLTNDTDEDANTTLTAVLRSAPSNGTLTFNGNGSFEYEPNKDFNGSDSFTYTVSDGTESKTGTVNITVDAVNDAPTLTLTSASVDYVENDSPVVLSPNATLTDIDSASFEGGSLTVSFTEGQPTDRLTIAEAGGITINGSEVLYQGDRIGTYTGGYGSPEDADGLQDLVVTFDRPEATTAAVESLVRSISYSNASERADATSEIKFVINDGESTGETVINTNGLRGEYYDNNNFTNLALVRTDGSINFDLGLGSPDPGIEPNTFSIRWTGQIEPLFSESYKLYLTSDDGTRLYLDDQLVLNNFRIRSSTTDSVTLDLVAGQKYDIRIEYFEERGEATARLEWESDSQAREVVSGSQLTSTRSQFTVDVDVDADDAPTLGYATTSDIDLYTFEAAQPETPDSYTGNGGDPWLSFIQLGSGAVQTPNLADGATQLNTQAPTAPYAGYSNYGANGALVNPNFPVLNAATGYTLSFTAKLDAENHSAPQAQKNADGVADRAGFSVLLVSADPTRAIELGFWEDRIFAQTDGTNQDDPAAEPDNPATPDALLFTQAEAVAFNTTNALVEYTVSILGDYYTLFANGMEILSGELRDYTAANALPNPYVVPNTIFLGDDTPSAVAQVDIAAISVQTTTPESAPGPVDYTEGDGAIALFPSTFTVTDLDSNLTSATVQITTGYQSGIDSLALSPLPNGISNASFNTNNGTLMLTGNGTAAEFESALKAVTYSNNSEAPNGQARTFTVSVSDGSASNTLSQTIEITPVNDAPEVTTTSATVLEGSEVTLTAAMLNGTDVDNSAAELTYTIEAPTAGQLELMSRPGEAITTFTQNDINNGQVIYAHDGSETPTDSFKFSLADGGEDSAVPATGTFTINVTGVNDKPVIAGDVDVMAPEDGTAIGNVITDNITDADGDNLTTTLDSAPQNGSVILSSRGDFTYTPKENFSGDDSFTYRVSDGTETITGTVNIKVNAVNDKPVIAGDVNAISKEDEQATGNVVTNNITDIDGDSLTVTLDNAPQNGLASINSSGDFTYTPKDNFNGSDSFTYKVSDGTDTVTGTVKVEVSPVNDAPVIAGDINATVKEDEQATGNVITNNVTDVDGDKLTAALDNGPRNGSVSVSDGGDFTYTPKADFSGSDSFTYKVSDGNETVTGRVRLTVTATNDAPRAKDDAISVDDNFDVVGNLFEDLGNGVDSDGDSRFSAIAINANQPIGTEVVLTSGATLTLSADGDFRYNTNNAFDLASGQSATDRFTYTISDGNLTDTATVTVTINGTDSVTYGTEDNDFITGSDNSDVINGGGGSDILFGGGGSDIFYYQRYGDRMDQIKDFEIGKDRIDLHEVFDNQPNLYRTNSNVNRFAEYVELVQQGAHTEVRLDLAGDLGDVFRPFLFIENVAPNELSASDFVV